MAATMKLSITFVVILLLSGLAVFGDARKAKVTCANIRCIQGGNITCANTHDKVFQGCACLCAPKKGRRCVLHLQSGSNQNCPRTRY